MTFTSTCCILKKLDDVHVLSVFHIRRIGKIFSFGQEKFPVFLCAKKAEHELSVIGEQSMKADKTLKSCVVIYDADISDRYKFTGILSVCLVGGRQKGVMKVR